MASRQRERQIERACVQYALQQHGIAPKWVSPGWNGALDRLMMLPNGVCVPFEVKTADGVVSAVQARRIAQLNNLGFAAGVVRSVDDLAALHERALILQVLNYPC